MIKDEIIESIRMLPNEEKVQYRTKMDVYSRVVGYVRRVEAYNPGKQAEFKDRKLFKVIENEKTNN